MADRAILVGIGGTGCKCLESMVHVIAAGLVQPECEMIFIDQDRANFCTGRAQRVAKTYSELQIGLGGSDNRTEEVFSTQLSTVDEILQPIQRNDETLETAFSVERNPRRDPNGNDDAWLMRALFSEAERTASMNNGFRARPNVGSAAYSWAISNSSNVSSNGDMWQKIKRAIDSAVGPNNRSVDVVLFGSIFGGTGAAGMPTLGKQLRQLAKEHYSQAKVRVAASALLPYYDVEPPSGIGHAYGPASLSEVNLTLRHYHNLMNGPTKDLPFDAMYLSGIGEMTQLPYDREGGGGEQKNAQLLPELIGALGAAHFANQGSNSFDTPEIHYCLREHEDRITLRDLPLVGDHMPEPGAALVNLLRFGLAYLCAYQPILWRAARGERRLRLADFPFLRSFVSESDLQHHQNVFDTARIYFQQLLSWSAAVEGHPPGHRLDGSLQDKVRIDFFAHSGFANVWPAESRIELRFELNGAEADPPPVLDDDSTTSIKEAFRRLEVNDTGLEMHMVLERLALAAEKPRRGVGTRALFAALYDASRNEDGTSRLG